MDYISRNPSKYLLIAHLILVTKYRKQLLIKYGGATYLFDAIGEKLGLVEDLSISWTSLNALSMIKLPDLFV
jgi:hypothetical protein